jgi:hypothetical protein
MQDSKFFASLLQMHDAIFLHHKLFFFKNLL